MKMSVRDVMTSPAITVRPETDFKEVVRLMHHHRISAMPVVDDRGAMVGIVTHADLLVKQSRAGLERRMRLRSHLSRVGSGKAAGMTARQMMMSPVRCARSDLALDDAAQLLQTHHIKHLPVLDETGHLVGMVSRGDVLEAFLRSDAQIRREIEEELAEQVLGDARCLLDCTVKDGVIKVHGTLPLRSQVLELERRLPQVDGAVFIEARLGYAQDDASPREAPSR